MRRNVTTLMVVEIACIALLIGLTGISYGQSPDSTAPGFYGQTYDWSNNSAWTYGSAPNNGDEAAILGDSVANITQNGEVSSTLLVTQHSQLNLMNGSLTVGLFEYIPYYNGAQTISGSFTQTGGTNTILGLSGDGVYGSGLVVGGGSVGTGVYSLSGPSSLLSSGTETIGWGGGVGSMVQSNGATNNAGIMMIATDNSMSSGSYSLNGGSLQTTSLTIGGNTFGYITPTFTQQSGTCSCGGFQLNPTGQYNLNGPGLLLNVGQTESVQGGLFTQSAGTNNLGGGDLSIDDGLYSLYSPGLITNAYYEYVVSGIPEYPASFSQNGGTNQVSYLLLGQDPDDPHLHSGGYTMMGGLLTATYLEGLGLSGTGYFVHGGGTNQVGYLELGDAPGDYGEYTLYGTGLLKETELLVIANSGAGLFNQSGGTNDTGGTTVTLGNYAGSGGTYSLSSGLLKAVGTTVTVGSLGKGYFIQSGGTANLASSSLYLGYAAGSVGTYTLNNNDSPALLNTMNEYVGYSGSGGFTQSGGTHTVAYTLTLGYNAGSSGSYSLSGGSLFAGNGEDIGLSGNGSFTQSGGTNSSPLDLAVGDGGTASYSLSGGLVSTQDLGVGGMKSGVFTQSGGTVIAGGADISSALGVTPASYNLRSGLLSVTGQEYIGAFGAGSFVQSGGTHSISNGTLQLGTPFPGNSFSGSYNLSAGSLFVPTEFVGYYGTGSFGQSGGTHSVTSSLYVGYQSGSYGFYNLGAPAILSSPNEYFGYSGTGSIAQTGGTNTTSSNLYIGYNSGGADNYGLSGGVLNSSNLFVGYNGAGTVTHATGTVNASALYLGYNPGASGGYYFFGAGQLTTSFYEYVGYQGNGSFMQSAGVNSMQVLYLAEFANSGGTYSLGGTGVINNTNGEYVGLAGNGSFTQNGGSNNAYYLVLGAASGAAGSYALSNGLLNGEASEDIGSVGTGTFIQSGGTNNAGLLSLAPFGGSGTYSLNAGLLNVYGLSRGTGTTSFSIGAGTLQAGSSFATSVPISLNQSGGTAVFDSNGNVITLNGPLTGVGGLKKIGAGTLTLTVSNGYTGPTTLAAGTLVVANTSGSATGPNSVTLNGGVLAAGPAGGTIQGSVLGGNSPNIIAPGTNLAAGQYTTLNLLGGLTTNVYTTLKFDLNLTTSTGSVGINNTPIYSGDLINLGSSNLTVNGGNNQGGQIAFAVNPTQPGDYQLIQITGGSPNLMAFNLPSQSGMAYVLSTAVEPGYIDLIAAVAGVGASGGTWTSPNSGTWATAANWSSNPQVPSSGTVYFPSASGTVFVALSGNQSAGDLVFISSGANGYTLTQGTGGALALGTSNGASITVSSGAHSIVAPLVLQGNLTANIASGASLQLASAVSQSTSSLGLTLNGPGLLVFSGTGAYSGNTAVNSGTLQINAGGYLPANSEYVGTGAAAYVVQNGGVNAVSANGTLQGLIVGNGLGSAYYNLSGGLLNSANEFISFNGVATFTQTGGTNQAGNLSIGTFYNGTYNLGGGLISATSETVGDSGYIGTINQTGGTNQTSSLIVGNLSYYAATYYLSGGGQLAAGNEYIGYAQGGVFYQSGGVNGVAVNLYLGYQFGGNGAYNLSGSGLLDPQNEYIGYSSSGSFAQSGGTNVVTSSLYVGYNAGGSGTYNLNGGLLQAANEFVGVGGSGVFNHAGGTNDVSNLTINDGYYLLSNGATLQPAAGGTLSINNGGFQTASGVLDCTNLAAIAAGTGALLDLSNAAVNTAATSLSVGPDSLLIVPSGFNPASYASYSNQGLTHTLGSTLSVSAGTGFGGWGSIADPVACQGSIIATSGGWINLNNGLSLADPGQVNLGTGTLIVNDTNFSGMTGGALTASLMVVGSNGTGSFPQSGGASTLSSLELGCNAADGGTYALSGASQLSVANEVVGVAGSGSFTQSGGTHAVGTLYLAEEFGSAGTYNLNGGLLSLSALYQGGGAAGFNFGAGTLQAASPLTISMPIKLSAAESSGVIDTNGNAVTLSGPVSGPGGLTVTGTGSLTLGVLNSYTGTTLVSNGTLILGDPNALSGSTFDTSGTGALVFNGGIGGFAFGGLQGSGSLLLTDASFTDVALTVGLNNADTTFSGSLSDSNSGGSLTKVGTGTLTLSGANTFGGGTIVLGGTLALMDPAALLDGSSVAVGDPTDLGLFGQVIPSHADYAGMVPEASEISPVPEPGTLGLLAAAGLILGVRLRRKRA